MTRRTDRIAGAIALAAGVLALLEARTFADRFITEPVGPRGIPYLAALLVIAGGIWMALRPGEDAIWPPRTALVRIGGVTATLLAYAFLLETTGFFLTTTLAMTGLAVLYGASWRQGVIASAVFTAALYLLFDVALGLTLPIGRVFLVGT